MLVVDSSFAAPVTAPVTGDGGPFWPGSPWVKPGWQGLKPGWQELGPGFASLGQSLEQGISNTRSSGICN